MGLAAEHALLPSNDYRSGSQSVAGTTVSQRITIEDDEDTITPRTRPVLVEAQAGNVALKAIWSYRGDPSLPSSAPAGFDLEQRAKDGTTPCMSVSADTVAIAKMLNPRGGRAMG